MLGMHLSGSAAPVVPFNGVMLTCVVIVIGQP
jgi:hypothetical protein